MILRQRAFAKVVNSAEFRKLIFLIFRYLKRELFLIRNYLTVKRGSLRANDYLSRWIYWTAALISSKAA
mgnify:CR=1 FL=1